MFSEYNFECSMTEIIFKKIEFILPVKNANDRKFSVLAGMKIEKVFTPITEFDEIDITKTLITAGRLHYPKIAKKTRIDDFLARRTHLKLLEERRLLQSVSTYMSLLDILYICSFNFCQKTDLC